MHKVFPAKIDSLHSMLEWIVSCLAGWDRKSVRRVELASEEAIVNIIHHAYQGRPESIEISVKTFPKSAEIFFKDHGPPFDPLQRKAPDCSGRLEDREVGGLGIHFMRQYMDEVRYAREANCNVLVFVIRSSQNG